VETLANKPVDKKKMEGNLLFGAIIDNENLLRGVVT